MGMYRNRFGRNTNISIEEVLQKAPDLLHPHPLKLANLMKRKDKTYIESPNINMLAAAWIQFQTHDWFLHATDDKMDWVKIPNPNNHGTYFKFKPTLRDDKGHTINDATHWWDASMIYGSNLEEQNKVRTFKNGALVAGCEPLSLKIDESTGLPITAVTNNWWVGISLMHHIFIAEHNYVAERLAAANKDWRDEDIFQHARLIIAAILAKIHTVEWTPSILKNPVLTAGMNINWYGINHVFNYTIEQFLSMGVPASVVPVLQQVQKGVGGTKRFYSNPYAMSEEFVSVYRMHPLLPDEILMKSIGDSGSSEESSISTADLTFRNAEKKIDKYGIASWVNTFGYQRAGHLTFHNYPKFLTDIKLPDGRTINIAVMDIIRDRERLGLRYNELRRQLRLEPLTSFADLNVTPEEQAQLQEIYENDIELLDVFVSLMAEANWPAGYGFSTTAFYIFVIMASRRLETDRFYREYFNADIYTQYGIDYVTNTDFKTILLRHMPSLANNLANVNKPFEPW